MKSLLLAGLFALAAPRVATASEPLEPSSVTHVVYTGICDASAAVALNEDLFAVADDEENSLFVYRRYAGGPPVYTIDLTKFLRLPGKRKSPETDLEAATRLDEHLVWITSHGRNSRGREQPNRQRLFVTRSFASDGEVDLSPLGQPYTSLLQDLLLDPRLKQFNLAAAAQKPPKAAGGLNIEGLCSTPEGHLLIGFRNPIPQGQALLVPLLNPREVLFCGTPATLGEPMLLELEGLGIRSLARKGDQYLIVAGSHTDGAESRLFTWDGKSSITQRIPNLKLDGLNPEALAFTSSPTSKLEIISDDGTVPISGLECKRLTDRSQKRFRAAWIFL